jgi:hypothetical protein
LVKSVPGLLVTGNEDPECGHDAVESVEVLHLPDEDRRQGGRQLKDYRNQIWRQCDQKLIQDFHYTHAMIVGVVLAAHAFASLK